MHSNMWWLWKGLFHDNLNINTKKSHILKMCMCARSWKLAAETVKIVWIQKQLWWVMNTKRSWSGSRGGRAEGSTRFSLKEVCATTFGVTQIFMRPPKKDVTLHVFECLDSVHLSAAEQNQGQGWENNMSGGHFFFHYALSEKSRNAENKVNSPGPSNPVRRATDSCVSCRSIWSDSLLHPLNSSWHRCGTPLPWSCGFSF